MVELDPCLPFSNPCLTWASKIGALTRSSGKQVALGFSGRRQPGYCLRAPGPCVAVRNYLARPMHDALRPLINAASCETRAAEQKFQAGALSRSIQISSIRGRRTHRSWGFVKMYKSRAMKCGPQCCTHMDARTQTNIWQEDAGRSEWRCSQNEEAAAQDPVALRPLINAASCETRAAEQFQAAAAGLRADRYSYAAGRREKTIQVSVLFVFVC